MLHVNQSNAKMLANKSQWQAIKSYQSALLTVTDTTRFFLWHFSEVAKLGPRVLDRVSMLEKAGQELTRDWETGSGKFLYMWALYVYV